MTNNYNREFQITENIGNNIFCFDKLKNPKIYIPNLITVDSNEFKSNIEKYLKIWKNPVFREEKNWEIIEYKWLEKFIQINNSTDKGKCPKDGGICKQTIYIVDNHNHALYFRYKEYFDWNIQKLSKLIHIDQHTDMNENKYSISTFFDKGMYPEDGGVCKQNLKQIFNFTNKNCNVWNFIKPAVEEWLISKITQINTEYALLNNDLLLSTKERSGEVLDIDLDFRAPEMSIAKYQKTIDTTKKLIQNSRVVTIATSPYFLDQNLAIKLIKDLFT